jgi:hypothetical protein
MYSVKRTPLITTVCGCVRALPKTGLACVRTPPTRDFTDCGVGGFAFGVDAAGADAGGEAEPLRSKEATVRGGRGIANLGRLGWSTVKGRDLCSCQYGFGPDQTDTVPSVSVTSPKLTSQIGPSSGNYTDPRSSRGAQEYLLCDRHPQHKGPGNKPFFSVGMKFSWRTGYDLHVQTEKTRAAKLRHSLGVGRGVSVGWGDGSCEAAGPCNL